MTTPGVEARPPVAPKHPGPAVHIVGTVLPGTCGIRDHGTVLGAQLRDLGMSVRHSWLPDDGRSALHTLRVALQLARLGLTIPREECVIWQYASYGYAFRGISFPGTLFGLLCRIRGVPVIGYLHELQVAADPHDWRVTMHSITHRVALRLVLAGTTTPVVTMDDRVQRLRALGRSDVRMVPVYSNIPMVAKDAEEVRDGRFTVGILGFNGAHMRPDLLFGALRALGDDDVRVVVLGGPGPSSPAADRWRDEAERHGVAHLVDFSGILSADELSRRISACDLFAQIDEMGASSRRGTIAAMLAHGRPIVTLAGPEQWAALLDAEAVCVVPPTVEALAEAIERLRRSPSELAELGLRAGDFYTQHMRPELAAQAVAAMVMELARERPPPQVPVKWAARFSRKLAPDSRASLRALRAKLRPADS